MQRSRKMKIDHKNENKIKLPCPHRSYLSEICENLWRHSTQICNVWITWKELFRRKTTKKWKKIHQKNQIIPPHPLYLSCENLARPPLKCPTFTIDPRLGILHSPPNKGNIYSTFTYIFSKTTLLLYSNISSPFWGKTSFARTLLDLQEILNVWSCWSASSHVSSLRPQRRVNQSQDEMRN